MLSYQKRINNDSRLNSTVGGCRRGPSRKKILIHRILNITRQPIEPQQPQIETPQPDIQKYTPEELSDKSIQELQQIIDDETNRLPLSQRFDQLAESDTNTENIDPIKLVD